jgi:phage tail P2-like protein
MSSRVSLLPPNATDAERSIEAAMAASLALDVPVADNARAAIAAADHLAWLAWALSIDTWRSEWPVDVKRANIAASVEVHRTKGTRGAVDKALRAFGFEPLIIEWFENGAAPFTFLVKLSAQNVVASSFRVDAAWLDFVTQVIENTKPARAQYEVLATESPRSVSYMRVAMSERQTDAFRITPVAAPSALETTAFGRAASRDAMNDALVMNFERSAV